MKQPNPFQSWVYSLNDWQGFDYPVSDQLAVHKVRDEVEPGEAVPWPDWAKSQTLSVPEMHEVGGDGRGKGTPMQAGAASTRELIWGYAKHGQRYRTRIPRPDHDDYWISGAPNPMFDRHCIIVAPSGEVHEIIQFNPSTPGWFFWTTQALGWGVWHDGRLVEGRAVTATRLPIHATLWQDTSPLQQHRVGITLADYVGADGLLDRGPEAGRTLVLNPDSVSYRRMMALGGQCAALAEAMVRYGVAPRDRSGYSDSGPRELGTKPYPPGVDVQAGAEWATTNIDLFEVQLTDLVYAL